MRCSKNVRRRSGTLELAAAALLLLAACDDPGRAPAMPPDPDPLPTADASTSTEAPPAVTAPPPVELGWTVTDSDGATVLVLREGRTDVLRIACLPGGDLLVHGERFSPVGSEERMSIGAGNTVVTLVATPADDRDPPTVKGRGPIDADFVRAVGEGRKIAVNHGFQNMGPFTGPSEDVARQFVAGCTD